MSIGKGSEKTITVIGGGPSGMAAAISAARQRTGTVRLLEKNAILGRKLLATGNGRCNLTNTNSPGAEETIRFFTGLGLLTRTETEGRVYPYSEQAAAVQETLINELADLKVDIQCGLEVKSIEKAEAGFRIITDRDSAHTDAIILATGGKAGPQYGSTGDGYRFAKTLGHHVVSVLPSLVQLTSGEPFFQAVKGVRAKGAVELLRGDETVARETGEIQFTEDGLSGICIFNLSKEYVRGDMIKIDLFPEYRVTELENLLSDRVQLLGDRGMPEFFTGMLSKKLVPALLTVLSLDEAGKTGNLNREEVRNIAQVLKGWNIPITGTKGWKEAQVTVGGVDLAEINPDTMESLLTTNLYFAGELLNVDGKCGGYNLQWAWSSGLLAGKSAAVAAAEHSSGENHQGRNHAEST